MRGLGQGVCAFLVPGEQIQLYAPAPSFALLEEKTILKVSFGKSKNKFLKLWSCDCFVIDNYLIKTLETMSCGHVVLKALPMK